MNMRVLVRMYLKILALSSSSSPNPHFSSSSWCSSKNFILLFPPANIGFLPTPQLVYRDLFRSSANQITCRRLSPPRICSSVQFGRLWSSFVAAKILVFLCFHVKQLMQISIFLQLWDQYFLLF